jgi:hypothetical protein
MQLGSLNALKRSLPSVRFKGGLAQPVETGLQLNPALMNQVRPIMEGVLGELRTCGHPVQCDRYYGYMIIDTSPVATPEKIVPHVEKAPTKKPPKDGGAKLSSSTRPNPAAPSPIILPMKPLQEVFEGGIFVDPDDLTAVRISFLPTPTADKVILYADLATGKILPPQEKGPAINKGTLEIAERFIGFWLRQYEQNTRPDTATGPVLPGISMMRIKARI